MQILSSVSRQQTTAEDERQPVNSKRPLKGLVKRPGRLARLARSTLKTVATLLILALALLAALIIWDFYVASPWTRDGSVRVQVASVAPQVSGQITEIRVVDNQFVHQGDVLYVIDPFDFQVSLDTAKAQLRQKAADVRVKQVQAERREHLTDLATTPEEQQQYAGNATQAQAAFDAAQAQVAQAEINLKRTQVRSPVNGYVTNLLLRLGDYAHAGMTNISVIDADSYWIDGYFEETKMAHICIGDRAEAQLMGYRDPIVGQVQTVTRDADGQARVAVFLQRLQELGWTDGRNMRVDYRWGAADADRYRTYAAELVALAPDVILASGSASVAALLQTTRAVPIVFTNVIDPVGAGYVARLARPGGNVTGFTAFEYSLGGKWLELFKEIAPR